VYLMRCMDAYPNTIPECVTIIDTYHGYLRAENFPKKHWQKFTSSQITQHAPFEKHSEVAWLLWLALRLNISVERRAIQALEQMKSSICLCLALALESRGLMKKSVAKSRLPTFDREASLYGANWLLMYEGAAQSWLPAALPAVKNDRYFKEMLAAGVKFFDPNAAPAPIFSLKDRGHPDAGRVAELLDSDENVYDLFEFVDLNTDYLGRRSRRDHLEEDEVEDDPNDDHNWLGKYRIEDDDDLPY
jgi:hypothetical protein